MVSLRTICLLLCVGVAVVLQGCGGSDDTTAAEVKTAHLHQAKPGDEPTIRMGWTSGTFPDPADVVAWLVYRGQYMGLAAEEPNLIDVRDERVLSLYEDVRAGAPEVTFSREFTYTEGTDQETGSVDITYDHPPLVPGQTYYYRARRIVKPHRRQPPIATAAATDFQLDPSRALGEPSVPQGPVTYFLPPDPIRPANDAPSIDPRYIPFEWSLSQGANEYQVRVYSNPEAAGQPVIQTGVLRPTGSFGSFTYDTQGGASPLRGRTTYYWVVCARRSGEAPPTCGNESGWLKSAVRQFRTASLPPPSP